MLSLPKGQKLFRGTIIIPSNLCAANRMTSMVSRERAAARRQASQLVSQIKYLGGIVEKKYWIIGFEDISKLFSQIT